MASLMFMRSTQSQLRLSSTCLRLNRCAEKLRCFNSDYLSIAMSRSQILLIWSCSKCSETLMKMERDSWSHKSSTSVWSRSNRLTCCPEKSQRLRYSVTAKWTSVLTTRWSWHSSVTCWSRWIFRCSFSKDTMKRCVWNDWQPDRMYNTSEAQILIS